jgi:tRNA(His) guanylyltransferase
MSRDDLGNRIKSAYEDRYRYKLMRRCPTIVRLDGRGFSRFTKGAQKPFDLTIVKAMQDTAKYLCQEIQGAKIAYVQSDEITLVMTDYEELTSQAFFDYNLQKICSVSAGMASSYFSRYTDWQAILGRSTPQYPHFDARVFQIADKEEVVNALYWRAVDWRRNSLQMLARSHFSHKELHLKDSAAIHEMLHQKGVNWADLSDVLKNGSVVVKRDTGWTVEAAPDFSKNRDFVLSLL